MLEGECRNTSKFRRAKQDCSTNKSAIEKGGGNRQGELETNLVGAKKRGGDWKGPRAGTGQLSAIIGRKMDTQCKIGKIKLVFPSPL